MSRQVAFSHTRIGLRIVSRNRTRRGTLNCKIVQKHISVFRIMQHAGCFRLICFIGCNHCNAPNDLLACFKAHFRFPQLVTRCFANHYNSLISLSLSFLLSIEFVLFLILSSRDVDSVGCTRSVSFVSSNFDRNAAFSTQRPIVFRFVLFKVPSRFAFASFHVGIVFWIRPKSQV